MAFGVSSGGPRFIDFETLEVKKYASAHPDADEPAINSTEHEAQAGQPGILPVDAQRYCLFSQATWAARRMFANVRHLKKLHGDETTPRDGCFFLGRHRAWWTRSVPKKQRLAKSNHGK